MKTQLNFKHILTLIWWGIFQTHKVKVMMYWEKNGMVDLYAFEKAKVATKEDWKFLSKKRIEIIVEFLELNNTDFTGIRITTPTQVFTNYEKEDHHREWVNQTRTLDATLQELDFLTDALGCDFKSEKS